jgi:hypothetical protein
MNKTNKKTGSASPRAFADFRGLSVRQFKSLQALSGPTGQPAYMKYERWTIFGREYAIFIFMSGIQI